VLSCDKLINPKCVRAYFSQTQLLERRTSVWKPKKNMGHKRALHYYRGHLGPGNLVDSSIRRTIGFPISIGTYCAWCSGWRTMQKLICNPSVLDDESEWARGTPRLELLVFSPGEDDESEWDRGTNFPYSPPSVFVFPNWDSPNPRSYLPLGIRHDVILRNLCDWLSQGV